MPWAAAIPKLKLKVKRAFRAWALICIKEQDRLWVFPRLRSNRIARSQRAKASEQGDRHDSHCSDISPIVALVAGILILILPRLLNYVVAIYLIVVGLIGLNGIYHFINWYPGQQFSGVQLDASKRLVSVCVERAMGRRFGHNLPSKTKINRITITSPIPPPP
jgi:hypothetical protein